MCPFQVCTEARDATKNAKKKSPKAKTWRGKKGTKARKGCVSRVGERPGLRVYIYIYIPGTCLSSILGLQPSKTRSFPIKTRVIKGFQVYINISSPGFPMGLDHGRVCGSIVCLSKVWFVISNQRADPQIWIDIIWPEKSLSFLSPAEKDT